jgi:hypothetical protein
MKNDEFAKLIQDLLNSSWFLRGELIKREALSKEEEWFLNDLYAIVEYLTR